MALNNEEMSLLKGLLETHRSIAKSLVDIASALNSELVKQPGYQPATQYAEPAPRYEVPPNGGQYVQGAAMQGGPGLTRPAPRKSELADLSEVSVLGVEQSRTAMAKFMIDGQTVPWSEAAMRKVLDYERMVEEQYGPEGVNKLPWKAMIPRGEDVGR